MKPSGDCIFSLQEIYRLRGYLRFNLGICFRSASTSTGALLLAFRTLDGLANLLIGT